MQERREELLSIYNSLYRRFGPQHWWPGDSPLEISIGAILTQNTAWRNVERAIENLKREGLLSVKGLEKVSMEKLRAAIRPAGYFNEKAKKIKAFIDFLFANYQGSLRKMFKEERETLPLCSLLSFPSSSLLYSVSLEGILSKDNLGCFP